MQYPHNRHGPAGKPSNHAKQDVLSQFLEFVDANSQPNGRQASSYSAQFFFLPKFAQVDAPSGGEKNYDEKCKSSIVYEFNRVQREESRQTCSSSVARQWLHQHRPKTSIHPSMTDYCDTCKYLREQLSRQQAILNRLQQSGSALEAEVKAIEKTKTDLEEELKQHKITATKARELYKTGVSNSGIQLANLQQSVHQRGARERSSRLHGTASHWPSAIETDTILGQDRATRVDILPTEGIA